MTAGEYAIGRLLSSAAPGADGAAMLAHFRRHGVHDAAMLEGLEKRKNHYPALAPSMPSAFIRMQEGRPIAIGVHQWKVITGFGHSPEHASLYCEELDVLVSGDMVLPRISTNVSVMPLEPEADPVQLYIDSLDKYQTLHEETLILPSHGKPFRGLHARIAQLNAHHAQRLEEVFAACTIPWSAADIVPLMFTRALDPHQLTFALGEALAHLHCLWMKGRLKRSIDKDGVARFYRFDV
jgi:glyoxylase-like metal-dependent hydrolase (beta-lactamase superfamily II)